MVKKLREKEKEQKGVRKAFTLVELLIVMVIIGILVAIAVWKGRGGEVAAQIASMKADADAARSAETIFYAKHRYYIDADVEAAENGESENLGDDPDIKVVASPYNHVQITTQDNDGDGSGDCYTITVTSSKAPNTTIVYDQCNGDVSIHEQ